jgi:hypothetical protein
MGENMMIWKTTEDRQGVKTPCHFTGLIIKHFISLQNIEIIFFSLCIV